MNRLNFTRFAACLAVVMSGTTLAQARPSESPEKELATAWLYLGDQLYQNHATEKTNLVYSPASIHAALLMTSAGAKGNTLAQMQKTLGLNFQYLPDPHAAMSPTLAAIGLNKDLDPQSAYQLKMANNLWLQEGYPIDATFSKTLKDNYRAEVTPLNFSGNADGSRQSINDAVAKQTQDKIKDLMPAGSIDGLTRLVLTNAVYFKADWASKFKSTATKDMPFNVPDGAPVNVPTMNQVHAFHYYEDAHVKVLDMPYLGRQLSMLVILPDRKEGLAAVKSLSDLPKWTAVMKPRQVTLALPKFKFQSNLAMQQDLKDMSDAFSDKADFSGITTQEKLHIDAIVHQAMIAVDEDGTEAAAATGVAMGAMSARQPPEPAEFIVDRPFLFAIRHNVTGAILFVGRVAKP